MRATTPTARTASWRAAQASIPAGTGASCSRGSEQGAGDGLGPGRGAGDVNGDGRPDLVVGSLQLERGRSPGGQGPALLRRRRIAPADDHEHDGGENLGFDAVGLGDVNGDEIPDALVSAATGDRVYIVAGAAPGKPKKND